MFNLHSVVNNNLLGVLNYVIVIACADINLQNSYKITNKLFKIAKLFFIQH